MRPLEPDDDDNQVFINSSLVSTCCGAAALGAVEEVGYGYLSAICSECLNFANFEKDTSDEREH